MVVQHNIQAMNASRMLNITSGSQSKSTEKLASGYKINRAADDAAGLSISEKMRKQIRGLDQASTNAQDGVSAVQTAEGALSEVHSMLQRMNELAVQAANGTNSATDRESIQNEIDQLTTEIDRVAETTKFNETYLLKGDTGTKKITLQAHDAGLNGTLVNNGDGTAKFTMTELNGGDSVSIGGKMYTVAAKDDTEIEDFIKDGLGTTEEAGLKVSINGTEYTYYTAKSKSTADGTETDGWGAGFYAVPPSDKGDGTGTSLSATYNDIAAIKAKAKEAGITTTINGESIHKIKDVDNDGIDDEDATIISDKKAYMLAQEELLKANQIGDTENNAKVGTLASKGKTKMTLTNATNSFGIQLAKAKVANTLSFNLHVGADADMTNKINVNVETMTSAFLGIKNLSVSDGKGNAATYAIDAISDALAKVSAQRSALGAIQNRLEHTIANVDNVVENSTAAESRIRDTDMADEMVKYSANNILTQAGQSMLAQANQATQGVLSLLG